MKIVIMGGDKLGYNVARNTLSRKYQMHLIGREYAKYVRIVNDLDIEVIYGDDIEPSILESASVKDTDASIAVTSSDQNNLVAAQPAEMESRAKKVIMHANNLHNLEVLRTMGSDIAVPSIEVITNIIEQEASLPEMHPLAVLSKGHIGICGMVLPDDTSLRGVRLMDVSLSENTLIVSVMRGGQMITLNGRPVLYVGDQAVAVCENRNQKKLLHIFGKRTH